MIRHKPDLSCLNNFKTYMIKENFFMYLLKQLIKFGSNHKVTSVIFFLSEWERQSVGSHWVFPSRRLQVRAAYTSCGMGGASCVSRRCWEQLQEKHKLQEHKRSQNAKMAKIATQRSHLKGENEGRSDSSPFSTYQRHLWPESDIRQNIDISYYLTSVTGSNYWKVLSKT